MTSPATNPPPISWVLPLDDNRATSLALTGGKGASLTRLAIAGLPVPPGFHLTTRAYQEFVDRNGLRDQILAILARTTMDEPASVEAASARIRELFAKRELPAAIAEAIRKAYAGMGGNEPAVAVRSSATAEDLPEMSFAGQQDTFLNIHGETMLLAAVKRCWASLWTARAIDYRARHDVPSGDVALAVVVQRLVPADAAGILFTADPVTGAHDQVLVNAAWGLGEAVVGGQVTPDTYHVDRTSGAVTEQRISDKTVMTVRTAEGTHEVAVPADRRTHAVLDDEQAAGLARLGVRIEELYDQPMDVEWAMHDGSFFILQARPITGLPTATPGTEEWNDSLTGDYLWTCANLGEAIPSVMTPCTWSLVRIFMSETMSLSHVGPHRISGNIGGRFYLNLSVTMSVGTALGVTKLIRQASEQAVGRIPDTVGIPPLPMSRWQVVREALSSAVPFLGRVLAYQKRLPALLAEAPARCEAARTAIRSANDAADLAAVWRTTVDPLLRDVSRMLAAGARLNGAGLIQIRPKVGKLVGEADTTTLLTGLHKGANQLASLGPVVGLAQVARGELDRETYVRQWGHRCPDEFEVSTARPAEDPQWIDRQLESLRDSEHDATALLARQEEARTAAWQRFERTHPRKVKALRRQIERAAVAARAREDARSEVIRAFWVLRDFVVCAGDLTGRGEDLFFLPIEEILDLLHGDDTVLDAVPTRRATYERYRALPPYPTLIRGTFDPFRWAADPNHRVDVFDDHHELAPVSDSISGFPGAAGVVDGTARVIHSVDEGDQLHAGEILVTTVTNVGWTPLFPRAAAVVTDIGAPLSHAAIVARELGIPAVVGCGNATMRVRSGDRIRVDGEHGTVEILASANP